MKFELSVNRRPGRRGISRLALSGSLFVAGLVAAVCCSTGAEARSTPFSAWPEPQTQNNMALDQAKTILAERTKPQTEWTGPTSGIRAPADPGSNPGLNLYINVTSNPAEIGSAQAARVLAVSNGTAKQIHLLDNNYTIVCFKAQMTSALIKNCAGGRFFGMGNIAVADTTVTRLSSVSGRFARSTWSTSSTVES